MTQHCTSITYSQKDYIFESIGFCVPFSRIPFNPRIDRNIENPQKCAYRIFHSIVWSLYETLNANLSL